MLAGSPSIIVVLLLLPATADIPRGCELPAQGLHDLTASLRVRVAEKGPAPGLGEVELLLTVTGGPGLEVEKPLVEDPTETWKVVPGKSEKRRQGDRTVWSQILDLRQSRPGPAELPPAVKLRLRAGSDAPWQTAEWTDLLRTLQAPAAIPAPPAAPARPPWLVPVLVGSLVLFLGAGVFVYLRRRSRPEPLRPEQVALRELERLEAAGYAADYHALLSDVVRRYLEERFGLHASRQTTSEFFTSLGQMPQLSEPQRDLLRSFLERCDLVKFARAASSPEECQATTALARAIIEQTTPPPATSTPRFWVKLFRSGRQAKRASAGQDR